MRIEIAACWPSQGRAGARAFHALRGTLERTWPLARILALSNCTSCLKAGQSLTPYEKTTKLID